MRSFNLLRVGNPLESSKVIDLRWFQNYLVGGSCFYFNKTVFHLSEEIAKSGCYIKGRPATFRFFPPSFALKSQVSVKSLWDPLRNIYVYTYM